MENIERIREIIAALQRAKLTSPNTKKLLEELSTLVPDMKTLNAFMTTSRFIPKRIPGPIATGIPNLFIVAGVVAATVAAYKGYKVYCDWQTRKMIERHYIVKAAAERAKQPSASV